MPNKTDGAKQVLQAERIRLSKCIINASLCIITWLECPKIKTRRRYMMSADSERIENVKFKFKLNFERNKCHLDRDWEAIPAISAKQCGSTGCASFFFNF